MSPQLDAALTAVAWCVVLYFIMLLAEVAIRLYTQIFAMFKRAEEREVDVKYTREYIEALNKLAESQKKEERA